MHYKHIINIKKYPITVIVTDHDKFDYKLISREAKFIFERYNYSKRIMLFDEDRLFGGQGLSTGTIAIGACLKWGFDRIFLSGFDFSIGGGSLEKLNYVINSKSDYSKIYRISNNIIEKLPINQIKPTDFERICK